MNVALSKQHLKQTQAAMTHNMIPARPSLCLT